MIHVPNVRATVDWYQSIGFTAVDTYDDGGDGLSFADLSFGESRVMFNSGGQPSTAPRRAGKSTFMSMSTMSTSSSIG